MAVGNNSQMKRFFDQIWNLLSGDDGGQDASPQLRRAIRNMDEILYVEEPDFNRMWQNIRSKTIHQSRRSNIISISLKVAAVAIPFVVACSLLFTDKKIEQRPVAVVKQFKPVVEDPHKVKLTLSDGSTIDLSKNSKDLLKTENATIQQASDRSLSYQAASAKSGKMEYNTVETALGATYQLKLSDGTVVFLNAKSKLRYPIAFVGKERQVYLEGEGYFEVKSDKSHPFKVNVGGVDVVAVGTQFNINSYSIRKGVQTTLVEGRVLIDDGGSEVALSPGQQATNLNGKADVKDVDCDEFTSWRFGRYVFSGVPLEDIMVQLERWYDVVITINSEELKQVRFTGMIDKGMPIEETLRTIEKTGNISYEIKGKQVLVK